MGGKRKTTEESLLSMTGLGLRYIRAVISGKEKKPNSTRLTASRLVVALKLDKDKREGRSTSSYESQLLGRGK